MSTKSSIWHLLHNVKSTENILLMFVAFLENMNFTKYVCSSLYGQNVRMLKCYVWKYCFVCCMLLCEFNCKFFTVICLFLIIQFNFNFILSARVDHFIFNLFIVIFLIIWKAFPPTFYLLNKKILLHSNFRKVLI